MHILTIIQQRQIQPDALQFKHSGCTVVIAPCPQLSVKKYLYISAGGDVSAGKGSPRPNRSSRPLSAVFQNIHPPNIWRHRKGTVSFNQVHLHHVPILSLQRVDTFAAKYRLLMMWMKVMPCFINKIYILLVPPCPYVVQVTVSEEGSISGTLQRSKKSKRSWKRLWFLLKDKVLYTYRAQEVRGNMHSPLT